MLDVVDSIASGILVELFRDDLLLLYVPSSLPPSHQLLLRHKFWCCVLIDRSVSFSLGGLLGLQRAECRLGESCALITSGKGGSLAGAVVAGGRIVRERNTFGRLPLRGGLPVLGVEGSL